MQGRREEISLDITESNLSQSSSCSSPVSQASDKIEVKNKFKIPIRLKPKKETKSTEMKKLPIKVKVKYENLYGRVIEYAKHIPRILWTDWYILEKNRDLLI